jgi:uridine kinase
VCGRVALSRAALVERLVEVVDAVRCPHPVRVALDGPDAAGKTTLAEELALGLRGRGREVVRASIDGFHRPRAERYRRGEDSSEGYYEDSFDYAPLRRVLLDPLGPGGDRVYRLAIFDFRVDAARSVPAALASDNDVLIFDGVFLLRPELFDSWDLRMFVSASFDEILRRALERDAALFGSPAEVERRYRARYIPGQKLYFATVHPMERADLVIDNDDPARPVLHSRISAPLTAARLDRMS